MAGGVGRKTLVLSSVHSLFFYGTLCHLPLLHRILGDISHLNISDAILPDHQVNWVAGESFPIIFAAKGKEAKGLFVRGLSKTDIARLDFYEGGYDYVLKKVSIRAEGAWHQTDVYVCDEDRWPVGRPWLLEDWIRDWSQVVLIAATEMMDALGKADARKVAQRYPQIMQRAASKIRAAENSASKTIRTGPDRDSVWVAEARRPYSEYFALEEMDVSFRQFDGSQSETVTRAAFVSGDAVTVLPYDPVRDRVMIIEQFRFGPYVRGALHPWSLEPVAGRIDPGETPEVAARRELQEEVGIQVGELLPVARYYPSPGAMTEFLFSFVGLADLPDHLAGLGGVVSEAEDIKSCIISFDTLMGLLTSGEAENGPLILTALWLSRYRDTIRLEA